MFLRDKISKIDEKSTKLNFELFGKFWQFAYARYWNESFAKFCQIFSPCNKRSFLT